MNDGADADVAAAIREDLEKSFGELGPLAEQLGSFPKKVEAYVRRLQGEARAYGVRVRHEEERARRAAEDAHRETVGFLLETLGDLEADIARVADAERRAEEAEKKLAGVLENKPETPQQQRAAGPLDYNIAIRKDPNGWLLGLKLTPRDGSDAIPYDVVVRRDGADEISRLTLVPQTVH